MSVLRERVRSGVVVRLALLTGSFALFYIVYLLALQVSSAVADFHQVQITQLMAGAAGNDDIEFIEIEILGFRQNCQAGGVNSGDPFGCRLPSTSDGAKLVFFDSTGDQTGEFLFPDNTPVGEAGRSILVGTQDFADAFNIQPDFIMPTSNVVADSGRVCYANVPGATFGVITCITYGEFTANGPLPITGSFSLSRVGNEFELGPAAPRNNANDVGCLVGTGDLAVTKTADPEPVRLGSGNLTYTISVSTCSPNGVTGVVVTDTLPLDVNFVSATPGCTGTTTVTCVLGTMSSGGSATVTIIVTPTAVGNLNNTVSVTGDQVDPNTGDNTASVTTTVNIPPPGEVEPNDPIASAQFLTITASGTAEIEGILGTIGGADVDDLDFFSFLGSLGEVVTIDIDNAAGGLQSFDSMVALFGPGPSFTLLIQIDDASLDPGSTSVLDSRIDNFTLPSTGIFTVGVTNFGRPFQNGGVVGPGTVRNGDYTLIISGVTPTPVTGPHQLVSIAVTPEAASVPVGLTQQFNATGDFTDGSTADLTSSVAWASSNPLVATALGVGAPPTSALPPVVSSAT